MASTLYLHLTYNHTIRIWNTATGDCQAELNYHPDSIHSAIFSSYGVFISHSGAFNQIHLSLQPSFLDMYKDTLTHTKNLQKIWNPPVFWYPQRVDHHLSRICLIYGSGDIFILEVFMHDLYIYIIVQYFVSHI